MDVSNQPTIRFIVELKSEKLVKSIDKKTDTLIEAVEALPEEQQGYWEQTKEWIEKLTPDDEAVFAVRAGVLIANLHLAKLDDVYQAKSLLNGFRPFQITPYTRASKFTFFPNGLNDVGYGPKMEGGSLNKYFENNPRSTSARKAAARKAAERRASLIRYYWGI
jgi:hypothetical protein